MKKTMALFAILATLIIAWPIVATADSLARRGIAVENLWARATASMAKTGGAYMTIRNSGKSADKLIGVASPVSKHVGLHQSLMEDNIMKMRAVDAIDVPAGGMAMLKPGGYHIMFMGLAKPFKRGDAFPITLTFEKAGEIKLMVKIMKAGAMGAMGTMEPKGAMKMKPAN